MKAGQGEKSIFLELFQISPFCRIFFYLAVFLLGVIVLFAGEAAQARSSEPDSTNVADVFQFYGFDPAATNCGVLVQISDIHMSLDSNQLANFMIVTNLDPRLVLMINGLSPAPTALIVTGDLSVLGSPAFGGGANEPFATQELILAREGLKQFTKFPVYIIPGNHDGPPQDLTNASLFNSVFTNISRYTNFTVAGLPVVGLDGHNGGWLDPEERDWLGRLRQQLDHSKQVMVAVHQPALLAYGEDSRETRRDLEWFFKPWTAPVWVISGHDHMRDAGCFPLGMTMATQTVCPAAQNWLIPTSNPISPSACGFYLWCITNGTVAGLIEGVLTNGHYYAIGIPSYTVPLGKVYDGVSNIVFLAEEGHFDRATYNVTNKGGWNTDYWISYTYGYTARLPIEKFTNATRALLIANPNQGTYIYLGKDTNSWQIVPTEFFTNDVLSVVIPPELRSGPLWLMASNTTYQFFVGGFGLATSNSLTGFQAWAGRWAADDTISMDTVLTNAGGIRAWDAYLYGFDAAHTETMREISGRPDLGGYPNIGSDYLRFAGQIGVPAVVGQSPHIFGPWTSVTNIQITATTNGWNEYVVTNPAPNGFFRIGSTAQ